MVMFWLEIKSDNDRVDYEALAIPGTSGKSKCM